jgi:cell division protein FtsL
MTRLNLILLLVVVLSALALVNSRHQSRKLFTELEREKNLARQYEVEWGQLQLEQSTLTMPGRIERVARETLQLQVPAANQMIAVAGRGVEP